MSIGEPSAELGDESKGVIVASVTSSKGKWTFDAWFYIRRRGDSDTGKRVRLDAHGLSLFPKNDFPDLPSRRGRLLAVSLEPGEYELYTWTLYIQMMGGYGYIKPEAELSPLPFVVSAGRVTYLGYLHAETLMGRNIFGIEIPAGGMPELSDAYARDASLLQKKFPMLSAWPIDKANLNAEHWHRQ